MSDVEGVTAEEATVEESVENVTPVVEEGQEQPEEVEETEEVVQEEGMSDEDFEKIKDDPKLKAYLEEQKAEAIKAKESNRKLALKHKDETILKLKEQIDKLEGKKPDEINLDDFETEEEFEAAKRKQELNEALRNEKLDDAKAELNAEVEEKINLARESFETKLEVIRKDEPDIDRHLSFISDTLASLDKEGINTKPFREYVVMESDMGVEVMNYLGKNPEITYELASKPWFIAKQQIQRIEQELSAPKDPPAITQLPEPPKKAKGASSPKKDPMKMSRGEFKKKYLK